MAGANFLLVASLILAVATTLSSGLDTHLNFYLHDVVSGSNPTAVQVIKGPGSTTPSIAGSFGDTLVIDDLLTDGPSPTSAAIGRAQGFYMFSSLSGSVLMMCINMVFTTGDYNGSTIAVIGRDDIMAPVRELAVVGGTGQFRMATGYVLWKTSSMNGPNAIIELDVYTSTENATIASTTPSGGTSGASTKNPISGSTGSVSSSTVGGFQVHAWMEVYLVVVLMLLGCVW